MIEFKKNNLEAKQQHPIHVFYDEINVGQYIADILVEDKVIIELKTVRAIDDIHIAQLLNYLKATDLRIGLILNFGKTKVEIKRIVNNLQ